MADVFISYSRKDKDFVRRLDEALTRRKRETWVDWDDIRPAEEFMQAIYSAIEAADTFLFVLTPDSLASVVCGREIAHAAAHNKRMVPLVAREVDAQAVPETLAKLNWIFFRDGEDFEKATDTLISALDTDLAWVRAHTRLLTRAVEWEAKGRNNSFALRGDDLRDAEQWLAQAGTDKERQPTALQTEYILASRKAASRRQRVILGAVTFGAVLALVLAALAWVQRGRALMQEKEANRQKEAALQTLSQADFAQATRLIKEQQSAQALAYLARAVRLVGHPAAGTRIVSLLTERAWPILQATQQVKADRMDYVSFSTDGSRAIVVFENGNGELWDVAAAKAIGPPERYKRDMGSGVFSPDGRRILSITDDYRGDGGEIRDHYARLWDAATGQLVGEVAKVKSDAVHVAFGPSGRQLVLWVGMGDNETQFWDAQTGRKLSVVPGCAIQGRTLRGDRYSKSAPVRADTAFAFSGDGERYLTLTGETGKQSLQVWQVATGKPAGRPIAVPADMSLACAALSPDGQRVAIGMQASEGEGFGGYNQVWDINTARALTPQMQNDSWIGEVSFNADGRWLLAISRLEARVWNAATGEPVTKVLTHPSGAALIAGSFSPEGQRVLTVGDDGSLCIWDAATGKLVTEIFGNGEVADAVFSDDGRLVITQSRDQTQRHVWNVLGGVAMPLTLRGRAAGHVDFSLLTLDRRADGEMLVWDVRSAKVLLTAPEKPAPPEEGIEPVGIFSEDGRRLLLPCQGRLRAWDLAAGKELPSFAHPKKDPAAELCRDGSRAITFADGIIVWEVESGKQLFALKPTDTSRSIVAASLSPDGQLVAAALDEGTIQLWDVATRQARPSLMPHGEAPDDLRFSPDSRKLVSFSTNATLVRLWDVQTGKLIGEPLKSSGDSGGCVFNHSGSRLAVSNGEVLRLVATDTGAPGTPMRHRGSISYVTFSPDDRLVATSDEFSSHLWDAETGRALVDPIKLPDRGGSDSASFSPDSKRLALAGLGPPEGIGGLTLVCDSATGAPLTDIRQYEIGGGKTAHFTPDGCRLVVNSEPARVWDITPPGQAPAWLADLAEGVGGYRLGATGVLEMLPDGIERSQRLKKELAALPADDRWGQVGRWFLTEPGNRAISPYSHVKVSDFARRRNEANSVEALQEALRALPDDAIARATLGVKTLHPSEPPGDLRNIKADHETLFATKLAPDKPEVWRARAKVLTALQRRPEAEAATRRANSLSPTTPMQ